MLFIPRNNKVYNYIAHTKPIYRYIFTGCASGVMILVYVFFIHIYLDNLFLSFTKEHAILQQQYKECKQVEHEIDQLEFSYDSMRNEIQQFILKDNIDESFKNRLFFVLKTAQDSGLKINSYGVTKETNHNWYKKELSHLDISGSLQQVMIFLDVIRNSKKMITVSDWSVVSIDNDVFQMHCEIGVIAVLELTDEKIPSTVNS